MNREIHQWHSPSLNKQMEIAVYGHYGFALLMFPTAAADFLEYERFQLIDAIAPFIDAGKLKAFSVNSINNESWLNPHVPPPYRALRHQQYNQYIVDEVVPFIRSTTSNETEIITTGASLGALHAANLFFRRPDIFAGTIAMSGSYDIKSYSDGYYDDNCYFNSPVDYLPNLEDEYLLGHLRSRRHIYILSGQGSYEAPERSVQLGRILEAKGVSHAVDLWGHDIAHDWPTWRMMLPHVLGTRF
ncbi:MAG: esterase family protein [Ignavibacteriae bacterium]|nr:esterase family protein [Ignavibacteriota bacterium]